MMLNNIVYSQEKYNKFTLLYKFVIVNITRGKNKKGGTKMSEEYWDQGQEETEVRSYRDSGTCIIVNGSHIAVDPGSSFVETVKTYAKDAGLGKFRVFFNGDEVKPSMAPDLISENDNVELRPYDVAGG